MIYLFASSSTRAQRGQPQPNEDFFAQRTPRAQSNNRQGNPPRTLSLRPLRLSAHLYLSVASVGSCSNHLAEKAAKLYK